MEAFRNRTEASDSSVRAASLLTGAHNRKVDESSLLTAIDGLYEAVLAPERWALALHNFARASQSVGCLFFPHNQTQALVHLPVSTDLQHFIASYVDDGWHLQDMRAARGWSAFQLTDRPVLTDDDISTGEERAASPYHQEFQRSWQLPNWAAIGFTANDGMWGMPLLRSERQGPISGTDARILAAAAPHLGRIIELATLLDARRTIEHLAVLHQSGVAAILLDWRGLVTGLTTEAESVLGADICVEKGHLVSRHRASNSTLQQLVRAALASSGLELRRELSASVKRQTGRPLIVKALPLTGALGSAFGQARVLIRISDPDARQVPHEQLLLDTFGLTAAEARLAVRLTNGEALAAAAQALRISKETARSQLKAIFGKTGVQRQSELLALLGRLN